MALLSAAVDDAVRGQGRVVLLAGEPGIGKTRLAEESSLHANSLGARVLWGRCWDSGGEPPFWPWIQLVRAGLHLSSAAIPPDLRVLSYLVPEFGSATEVARPAQFLPVAESLSEPGERFLLFDSVSNLFKRIAAAGPLILVVDDLHAADDDSLMLLRFLARDLKQSPILLIATYRDADVRLSPQRVSLLADVSREGITIPLSGLREEEIAELVDHDPVLRRDRSIAPWLHHVSGGNPFFLYEIARLLAAAPDKASLRIRTSVVPDTVRAAVQRRISAFKEETKALLNVCSLLGHEFELQLLKEVCGMPGEQIVALLDEAVANSLVIEADRSLGRYRFVHAITAEALRSELGASARLRLHQRIAAAIEVVYRDDIDNHFAELANHYVSTLPLGGVDKAVEFARRGAERARKQLAFAEASRLYAMALHALPHQPDNDLQRYDLLLSMGEAQAQGRSLNEARASFKEAITIARRLGRPDALSRAVLAASVWFDSYFKRDGELVSMLSDALDALEGNDSAIRVALMAKLAAEYYWSGDRRRGFELCDQSLAAARRIGDRQSLVAALWVQNQITWGPDDLDQRLTRITEIASLAESIGDYQHALRAHEMRFAALFEKGDLEAVDAEIRSYRLLAEKSGEQFGIIERFQAALALFKGDFAAAEVWTGRLARLAEGRQDPALLACSRLLKEAIDTERAQINSAEMEAVRKENIANVPTVALGSRASLALLYVFFGREAEARTQLEFLAKENFSLLPRDWNWLAIICSIGVVCVVLRDLPRAVIIYGLLLPYPRRNVTLGWGDLSYGCSSRYLGMLATMLGRFDEAQSHFDQASQFEELMGARPWCAYTKFEFARMLFRRKNQGDLDRALELARDALETAKGLRMKVLEVRAGALLAKATRSSEDSSNFLLTPDSTARTARSPERSRRRVIATILFVDIIGSTEKIAQLMDRQWVELHTNFFEQLRENLRNFGGRELETAGDSMLALFNHPAVAIRAASAMIQSAQSLDLQVRAGIHTGEVELVGEQAIGIAVHLSARVAACGGSNEVTVSGTVRDLMAGGDIKFADRGTHVLKGVPGEWRLYAVEREPSPEHAD